MVPIIATNPKLKVI